MPVIYEEGDVFGTHAHDHLFVSVDECSSCGEEHVAMAIRPLEDPVVIDDLAYTHVGMCPRTSRDVYVLFVD
jgi:hypothetical protein